MTRLYVRWQPVKIGCASIFQVGGIGPGGRECRTCGLVGVDLRLTGQDPEVDPPSGARSMTIS